MTIRSEMWCTVVMVNNLKTVEKAAIVQFGSEMQRLRRLVDMSQRELAKATLISHQMVGAIERAERAPRKSFAERADRALNAGGELAKLWPGSKDGSPRWFRPFAELEADAKAVHYYECQAVPGPFQTREYARAVLGSGWPPSSEQKVERLLEARMARQELLKRDPLPLLWVVVDEGVLRRPIGSREIMLAQLDRLLSLAAESFVRFQVMSFAKGVHAAMDGAFTLLGMPNGQRLAYAEMPGSGRVISDADEVEECTQRFGALQSLSLSPDESIEFISRYKEAHSHGIDPFRLA